jgi:two-component system, NtrC family, sensor kinase
VYRTLRFQLVAIVVATVATVLAISQSLDTRLSMRELERDLEARALLALGTVDSLWERSEPTALAGALASIVRTSREIVAIDVFNLERDAPVLALSTRSAEESAHVTPAADPRTLLARNSVTVSVAGADGGENWRLAVPIRRDGRLVGIAQADVSLASVSRLRSRLRAIDGLFLVFSVVIISLALGGFLERRVSRPVAALIDGMRRAESGALGSRVAARGSEEFAFLAGSLNRMLSRIEDLTTGLESRVRQATKALAEKNRELEEANEKLWRAQLEVVRSERFAALGQMAATIAHELGTPLNSVLGYTQLLLRDDLSPDHAAKLQIVESQVQRMIETMRSVLDRTRDRSVPRTPVALGPLVTEAMALVSARLAARHLEARAEVAPDLPPVPADAVGLRQVLLNLITNAIDATEPPGTITVSAALAANGRGAPHVEVVVRDTGHGMAAEEQRRVVEPFYTTKARGRGTGLGLVIVDHIVRAHGGRLVIESEPGQGTAMRVQLPLEA